MNQHEIMQAMFLGVILALFAATIVLMSGCSTMDSFGETGTCKVRLDVDCQCDCEQKGTVEEIVSIVK